MTVQTKIDSAYRKIGVLAIGQTLTSDQSSNALESLNDMLAAWAEDYGVPLSSGGLALSDAFPYDSADARAIVYNLALEIIPDNQAPLNPLVIEIAQDSLRRIQARYASIPEAAFDSALTNNTSFDILTG